MESKLESRLTTMAAAFTMAASTDDRRQLQHPGTREFNERLLWRMFIWVRVAILYCCLITVVAGPGRRIASSVVRVS